MLFRLAIDSVLNKLKCLWYCTIFTAPIIHFLPSNFVHRHALIYNKFVCPRTQLFRSLALPADLSPPIPVLLPLPISSALPLLPLLPSYFSPHSHLPCHSPNFLFPTTPSSHFPLHFSLSLPILPFSPIVSFLYPPDSLRPLAIILPLGACLSPFYTCFSPTSLSTSFLLYHSLDGKRCGRSRFFKPPYHYHYLHTAQFARNRSADVRWWYNWFELVKSIKHYFRLGIKKWWRHWWRGSGLDGPLSNDWM